MYFGVLVKEKTVIVSSEIKLDDAKSLLPSCEAIVWVIAGTALDFILNMQHVYQDPLLVLRWNTLCQICMLNVKWGLDLKRLWLSGLSLNMWNDFVLQAQAKPCTTWWYAIMTSACLYIVYIFKYLLVQQGDLKGKNKKSLCICVNAQTTQYICTE